MNSDKDLKFLAFDLGAESGRAVIGRFDGARLGLEEVHRFQNGPVRILDSLHWDVLRLFEEMKRGLSLAIRQAGPDLRSVAVDTWGVDFALLDRKGNLLGNPYHYRDTRTDGMLEEAFRRVPREDIYSSTGVQFLKLNTLYQVLAMSVSKAPALDLAETILMLPDLLNYWLTGRKVCEFTDATTTQFYDPSRREWARSLLERMGLPTRILPEIVSPGTVVGPLLATVADETGAPELSVVAPASHDTGSAVVAVPAAGEDHAYISSGTWSLMGVEVRDPILTRVALEGNFTNEGGVDGTFRFLKNIMGLWLVQECRREWERRGEQLSYGDLTRLASEAPPFGPVVDPDDDRFVGLGDMPGRIRAFCEETGQSPPRDRGGIIRCALESLALKYRLVFEQLEKVVGRRLNVIHAVGGGSQNRLLCQLTADAASRPVVAGPVEATAIGNVLVQAIAVGSLGGLADARAVVRRSFDVITYEPNRDDRWDAAYERFKKIMD